MRATWRISTLLDVDLTCHVELVHALPAGFICHCAAPGGGLSLVGHHQCDGSGADAAERSTGIQRVPGGLGMQGINEGSDECAHSLLFKGKQNGGFFVSAICLANI